MKSTKLKKLHPTNVRVPAGEQLVARMVRVNGHSWQVVLAAKDALFYSVDDEENDDAGLESEINLGNGSDPEEAIDQALYDLDAMIVALRKHKKGLNARVEVHEAAFLAKKP